MLKRLLLAGALTGGLLSAATAQTYKDASGTVAPGIVPLIGCATGIKCVGPVSSTNPLPVTVTIGGSGVSAANGLFVNPATGATFPISGSVSVTGAVTTVASNPAQIFSNQQTCGITATALPAQSLTNGVVVKALKTNTATVYVGGSTVTTASGYPLVAGESISYAVSNLSAVYLICQNSSDVVAITGN